MQRESMEDDVVIVDADRLQQEKALLARIKQHETAAQPWIAKTIELALGAEADQICRDAFSGTVAVPFSPCRGNI